MMKKLFLMLCAALALSSAVRAAEEGPVWDRFPSHKVTDTAALQNGAKLFVNYCLNCHSASYMRYNRMRELDLTEAQIKANLMFATDKVGDTMKVAIDPVHAKEWFGATPPDLTVIARSRGAAGKGSGADYLYTYLRSYYRDDTKLTGWNNLVFPSVGMPHVLWELQGDRRPVFDKVESHGHAAEVFKGWEQVTPGTMTPLQFDQAMGDLVAYMQWMAEPAQNTRIRVGVWVMLFLVMALVFVWRLNASYWKDVK
jgi:ubiquinol-cytochrome c reductase cytochrome c1 subunit